MRRSPTATAPPTWQPTPRPSGSSRREEAAEIVRETWRLLVEFNANVPLALEALLVRLRDAFAGVVTLSA